VLVVQCKGCNRVAFVDCPEAHEGGARTCGDPECGHRDPDAAFDRQQPACGAEGRCCRFGHKTHTAATKDCPGGHEPQHPGNDCSFALMEADQGREQKCIGHCGDDVPGCKVCRPLQIILPAGHGPVLRAAAGG
jgi:hypothetical protein